MYIWEMGFSEGGGGWVMGEEFRGKGKPGGEGVPSASSLSPLSLTVFFFFLFLFFFFSFSFFFASGKQEAADVKNTTITICL